MGESLWQGWERAEVLRVDDFLVGVLRWRGLAFDARRDAWVAGSGGGTLVLELPAQHVEELAYSTPEAPVPLPGGDGVLAAPSRIALQVEAGTVVKATIEGVVDALRTLPLSVDKRAAAGEDALDLDWLGSLLRGEWRVPGAGARRLAAQLGALEQPPDAAALSLLRERATMRVAGSRLLPDLDLVAARVPPIAESILGRLRDLARFSPPGADETSLELPARLVLSPDAGAGFAAEALAQARGAGARTELWHARLGRRVTRGGEAFVSDGDASSRILRAVWSRGGGRPEQAADAPVKPGDSPSVVVKPVPDAFARWELVRLTTDAKRGRPVRAKRLHLTSLGASVDHAGAWAPWNDETDGQLTVEEWAHRATLGRDQYVRVVYAGWLLPWGHPASLVEIAERRLQPNGLLKLSRFVVVRRAVQEDHGEGVVQGGEHLDRLLPFTAVECRTRRTREFTPQHANRTMLPDPLAFTGHGLRGEELPFTAPAMWVRKDIGTLDLALALGEWGARAVPADGRPLSFLPGDETGATVHPVHEMTITTALLQGPPLRKLREADEDHAPFVPRLASARVGVPALQRFGGGGPVEVVPAPEHVGAKANAAGVYLHVTSPPVLDAAAADRAGALLRPAFPVKALSQVLGPVGGDPASLAAGRFDPAEAFAGLADMAKLFGAVDLMSVVLPASVTDGLRAPRFVTEALDAVERVKATLVAVERAAGTAAALKAAALAAAADPTKATLEALRTEIEKVVAPPPQLEAALREAEALLEDVDRILTLLTATEELSTKVRWAPEVKGVPGLLEWKDPKNALLLQVEAHAKTSLQPEPRVDVLARAQGATLKMLGGTTFLSIQVDKLELRATTGRKPEIDVQLGDMRFEGPLAFVETLRTLIPLDGFSDPPAIAVDEQGVTSSFSLNIPTIAFGVFALKDLSVGAGFRMPWLGEALSATFEFCTRERPFLLTVSGFGGGGYLLLSAAASTEGAGVEVEAGFTFGASLALDFGVASGECHVLGGFTFALKDGGCELTGFLRIGGSLEVIGLITVSVELSLTLAYKDPPKKCIGRATLVIEVEVAFFSTSVELECERRFAGSDGDPPYRELVSERTWTTYEGAFA